MVASAKTAGAVSSDRRYLHAHLIGQEELGSLVLQGHLHSETSTVHTEIYWRCQLLGLYYTCLIEYQFQHLLVNRLTVVQKTMGRGEYPEKLGRRFLGFV